MLIHGECLAEMDKLIEQGVQVDCILTDPPYGTTACKWDSVIPFDEMWERLNKLIKPNGAIVLFGSQPFTSALIMSNPSLFKYLLVWDKKHGKAPGVAKYRPMPSHEDLIVFGKGKTTYNPQMSGGKPYTDIRSSNHRLQNEHKLGYGKGFSIVNKGTRYPLSVIEMRTAPFKGQHPTQKPVALMEYLIKTYTNEGETVLDFTMGSGTTGVATKNTNRNFIGIELDEQYFEIAKNRIEVLND
jgi:site-specific DNA-methyltransferase (adenine-specific)